MSIEGIVGFVREKPWLVFAILVAAGIICGLLGISRLAVVLFMLSNPTVLSGQHHYRRRGPCVPWPTRPRSRGTVAIVAAAWPCRPG